MIRKLLAVGLIAAIGTGIRWSFKAPYHAVPDIDLAVLQQSVETTREACAKSVEAYKCEYVQATTKGCPGARAKG